MKEIAEHPFMRKFWRQAGTRWAENNSMTEDDYSYTVEMDESRIRLREDRINYYTADVDESATFEGRWKVESVAPERVVLRLEGIDGKGREVERCLCVTEKDILYGSTAPASNPRDA
jgi:hypothetical protein